MVTEHDVLMWVIPAAGVLIAFIGGLIVNELKEIGKTNRELCTSLAVIAQRVENHDERISSLESKV